MTTFIILGFLVGFVVIYIHNGLISRHISVKQAWADVITQERQKSKIIPPLTSAVKEYEEFESSLMKDISKLRSALLNIENKSTEVDLGTLQDIEVLTSMVSSGFKATVEEYPQLKTDTVLNKLMSEISIQEDNVGSSIRLYNSNVAIFNTHRSIFPNNLVNRFVSKLAESQSFESSEHETSLGFSPNSKGDN
ncbi:hypothetical protein A1QO_04105 [Vibrio genomosp. F10 str. ZF-129]|uniref:LemA family protein n=1 Tax=Vibrio genomosp. F10 str. ZF-129 TaxID=1187848 RepID=A0A1E5BIL6_9VIBR|nr:LemA family protein [Vibrio genomosp. F10]OEE37295.1 hypothetical protein A1QO_04105 [Vibrio genomosp. F10 str. ZF-129]